MSETFRTGDWDRYRMTYDDPHRELEPPGQEIAAVDDALAVLVAAGILPHCEYDRDRMLAHRQAVQEQFDIPWTAISPRMQRLLYAINAIARPARMIAAGIFCGNTFISNAGAAVGPGACYRAEDLVGVEIDPDRAALAERNVRLIDPTGVARILAEDAIETVRAYPEPIDLLYVDADGAPGQGKRVYLDILQAAGEKLRTGAVILAHNSVNCAHDLAEYLAFVRGPAHCRASVNVIFDPEGLEVTAR